MATSSHIVQQHRESAAQQTHTDAALKRGRLVSQVFFVVMTFTLWLGVGLPAIWGGALNVLLLLTGAFSMYKVFTGVRVTV